MSEEFKDEKHRAFVRDVNTKLLSVYGFGGGGVALCGATILVIAYFQHLLGHFATWMVTLTMMLIALYVLRGVVAREKSRAKERVRSYCEANKIDDKELRQGFDPHTYVYFFDLFKEP